MTLSGCVSQLLGVGLLIAVNGWAEAQSVPIFPNKPIRIVTSDVGANGDFVSRALANELTGGLGQQVIVENRGGNAVIPFDIVMKGVPDGHTLLVSGAALWLLPFLQNVSYDPVRDFLPVGIAANTPALLVVHPSLPVKSLKELIAMVKAKPGALNYASGISGSSPHLGAELFKAMAGVDIVRVVYKGGGPALNAIVSGEVQVMFAPSAGAAPHVNAGRLRALAVTTAQPSALFPNLPTVASQGLPGYESASGQALFAPGKTPASVMKRLNSEAITAANKPEFRDRFLKSGYELVTSSPEQAAALVKAEMARMGKVIKEAGIRSE